MSRRGWVVCAVLAVIMAAPVSAFLKLGTRIGNRTITLQWERFPIRYFVTNRAVDRVTPQQFQSVVARAFNTWHAVPGTETSSTFAGFTQASPLEDDGATVLGYLNRPDLDRTLAATTFLIDTTSGEIVESDIFFNSAFSWSTADAGEANRFDVESIALHEIGHLLGLSHSALGETELRAGGRRVLAAEAVMFPIAFSPGSIQGRSLKADDIAGITDIYATDSARRGFGSISGRVTKNGSGVFGAHIVAFNPATGKLVGGFSLSDDGSFVLSGLEPGPQLLRAEPLDDGDIESFFDTPSEVDVNFRVKFFERIVVVPRGGGARDVEIKVSPK